MRPVAGGLFGVALLVACGDPSPAPRAQDGVIDLRAWDFEQSGPVRLEGDWGFVWRRAPTDLTPWDTTIRVPGSWTYAGSPAADAHGAATYRLRVLLPEDPGPLALSVRASGASRVWVDGAARPSVGVVGGTPETTLEDVRTQVFSVQPDKEMVLSVEVANFRHRQSGLRRSPVLGTEPDIYGRQRRAALIDAAIVSPILFLGVLYGFLHFLRQKERAYLWFGAFALVLGVRHLFAGEGELVLEVWPDLPWPLRLRAEYFLFPLSALPAFPWLQRAAGIDRPLPIFRALIAVGAVLVALMALLPLGWLGYVVYGTIGFTTVSMIAGSSILVRAAIRGQRSAWGPLLGAAVFSVGFVHDALLASGWIRGAEIAPVSFLGMLLIEGALLAASFVRSYALVERLADEMRALNASLERAHRATLRFVPHAFLALLGRKSVVEVQRGDHTQQTMEVVFCDIRGFTTLIEGLGPERAFSFVNRYLAAMEPAITSRGGFISQYLGDCIVALFPSPRGADGAVASAIEMCERLRSFNLVEPEGPVRVGVGLSSGPLMLGTIGGQERLDGGVIGDPVNQASRIEGLTKEYGVQVLIGEPTRARLAHPESFSLREVDRVVTKGKTEVMRIYEVLDALEPAERDRRLASSPRWRQARDAWERGDFQAARAGFVACLEASPDDEPARRQVARCDKMLADPPATWDGVTAWTTK